jgi:SAM-dependent methyltransferase
VHERRYQGTVERLRSPERLAWLEVPRVVAAARYDLNEPSVLDVGTGSGVFAEAFAASGLCTEGVDANEEMIAAAREIVPSVVFSRGTAEALPYHDGSFDLVFMGLLLHEADDRRAALAEAARVARRRVAVLEFPYRAQEVGPPLEHRITEGELRALAAEAGLDLVRTNPLEVLVLFTLEPRAGAEAGQARSRPTSRG